MSSENTESSINSSSNIDGAGSNGSAQQATEKEAPKDALQEAQEKHKEIEKKYLYLYADFENFRRRAEAERLNYIKFGHEGFMRDLLQVLDNYDRGLEQGRNFKPEKSSPLGQIMLGLEMIQHQFQDCLKNQGVTEIKSLGEDFNPAFHEAIAEEEAPGSAPNKVLKELTRGYLLHGRLLRAARVVIAKKPA